MWPAARAHGTHRDHGLARPQHGGARSQQPEVRAARDGPGSQVHHGLVGEITVGENYFVDAAGLDQLLELALRVDRNALRVTRAGQRRGVAAPRDVRDLGGGEGHHLHSGVVPEGDVEVVEVAPGRAQDQDPAPKHLFIIGPSPRAGARPDPLKSSAPHPYRPAVSELR
jgi:hypothetical protein